MPNSFFDAEGDEAKAYQDITSGASNEWDGSPDYLSAAAAYGAAEQAEDEDFSPLEDAQKDQLVEGLVNAFIDRACEQTGREEFEKEPAQKAAKQKMLDALKKTGK